jgi:hypothetical protein
MHFGGLSRKGGAADVASHAAARLAMRAVRHYRHHETQPIDQWLWREVHDVMKATTGADATPVNYTNIKTTTTTIDPQHFNTFAKESLGLLKPMSQTWSNPQFDQYLDEPVFANPLISSHLHKQQQQQQQQQQTLTIHHDYINISIPNYLLSVN